PPPPPPPPRPGAPPAPSPRPPPTGTGKVPLTTGQTGPAGKPLTFRGLTIRPRASWRAGGGGDHVGGGTSRGWRRRGGGGGAPSRACRRSAGGVDCPGFLLLGPSQIAIASELSPYDPERPWHPGAGVEGCPQDRDGLAEVLPARPAKRGRAKVR